MYTFNKTQHTDWSFIFVKKNWTFYLKCLNLFFTTFLRSKNKIFYFDKALLLSTVSTLMAIEDNTTFEQREITIRIALRRIMFMGRGLVLNWLDREVFVRWTQKMASTYVHSIEKKINVWHTLNINTSFGASIPTLFGSSNWPIIPTNWLILLRINDIMSEC